jgi:NAD(P)H-flavin reductase
MQANTGIIQVIQTDPGGVLAARFDCAIKLNPVPGKYLLAHNPAESEASIGVALFPVGLTGTWDEPDQVSLGPIPASWRPGTGIDLFGPLGHGFQLPKNLSRLGLAGFGGSIIRLLPLVTPAVEMNADVVIFASERHYPDSLPVSVEVQPLSALSENLSWASYMAFDIPIQALPSLRESLGLGPHDHIPCPVGALIEVPMPCGAVADCGACAVPARRGGYRLACKDGPVFDLKELEW